MQVSQTRRRPPKSKTERQEAIDASAAHLGDLKRAHRRPPADVDLPPVAVPKRLVGEAVGSFCTSAADLCAELMR
ncbi:MAG TPA: hypothetical protein VGH40_22320 [Roseiarcus sp.]|jgi:hypothetical protein